MTHEFDLIAKLRAGFSRPAGVKVGLGDDTAVLDWSQRGDCLVTVDMLMEGVDFTWETATPRQVGRKSLAVNLSDIAAMAGRPVACVVAVSLPKQGGWELGLELLAGIRELAEEFDVAVVGGDTNTWNGPLVISITVLGEPTGRGPVLRSGAQVGDRVFVTGPLGGSLLGHHLTFTPRVALAQQLHARFDLHSLIDLSDGLAADLGHILEESRVGAVLETHRLPVTPAACLRAKESGRTPLEHALSDGEDFELVGSLPASQAAALDASGLAVCVGEIVERAGLWLRHPDGTEQPLAFAGWKHGFTAPG